MVWIPAGTFIRGSHNDKQADPYEKPWRLIYLDGYWMYKYPVTVAQFRKFCQAKSYVFYWDILKPEWGWIDDHPMVNVTWFDADAYCHWAEGELPTEAQWEKAARGVDGRKYPWGTSYDESKTWGSVQTERTSTAPVHRSQNVSSSPYGCMDMAGNVCNWCLDWYGETYYASSVSRNPAGPKDADCRVLRGGAWLGHPMRTFRTTYRSWSAPIYTFDFYGFRVSLSASKIKR